MEIKKPEIVEEHDYSENPVILEVYIEDEAIFRRLTRVVKFVEYSDGHSEIVDSYGHSVYVKRPIVMYSAYNRT